ncbi:MAG: hypothetical protein QM541_05490 [Flavobacterium sp.]|nr:hypothetical protein [Flavobacterium sp.]
MSLIDTGIEKGLIRFDEDKKKNPTANKKEITEMIQADKSAVQSTFTDKVNLFKEELTETFFFSQTNCFRRLPNFYGNSRRHWL